MQTQVLDALVGSVERSASELATVLAGGAVAPFRALVELVVEFGDDAERGELLSAIQQVLTGVEPTGAKSLWQLSLVPLVRALMASKVNTPGVVAARTLQDDDGDDNMALFGGES